ncbi:hypothetical protein LXA43DRAFT_565189 [Ganoderma leucocontextum]|nr:hypothetical protein LXA43DRAFT_565189 [Ganoderma leucocontextum]
MSISVYLSYLYLSRPVDVWVRSPLPLPPAPTDPHACHVLDPRSDLMIPHVMPSRSSSRILYILRSLSIPQRTPPSLSFRATYVTQVNNSPFGASRFVSLCLTFISLLDFFYLGLCIHSTLQQEPPIPSVSCPLLVSVGLVPMVVPVHCAMRVGQPTLPWSSQPIPPFAIPYPFFCLFIVVIYSLVININPWSRTWRRGRIGRFISSAWMLVGFPGTGSVVYHLTLPDSPLPSFSLLFPPETTLSLKVHAYAHWETVPQQSKRSPMLLFIPT